MLLCKIQLVQLMKFEYILNIYIKNIYFKRINLTNIKSPLYMHYKYVYDRLLSYFRSYWWVIITMF